jgi:hypothetical protein
VLNGIDPKSETWFGWGTSDHTRQTRDYYAAAEARGRAIEAARDAR